jgi:hypothetical protein
VDRSDADRYRKRFGGCAHVWMLLLHAMSANQSLRQSHAQQQADPKLRQRLGMDGWVSFSQLARSSTSRPPECFERLLASVVRHARGRPGGSLLASLPLWARWPCWTLPSSP